MPDEPMPDRPRPDQHRPELSGVSDLAATRHEAVSDDGLLGAAVDGSGAVLELRLDPKAMRLPSADLAAQATAVLQAAQQRARLAVQHLATPTPAVDDLTALAAGARARLDEMTTELSALLGRLGGRDER